MPTAHDLSNDASPAELPRGLRIVAVDWSGRAKAARQAIWLAEVARGAVLRLESGRDRDELVDELVAMAAWDRAFVVGLDFAFSLPAWFLRERGLTSARELWALLAVEADAWLREPPPPFWSSRSPRLPREQELRRTELELTAAGIRPQSVFKLVGAGQVGPGSLRGMRALHRLTRAGFAVWPFDEPRAPLVVEIYPRLLTGPVVKSSADARAEYLTRLGALDARTRASAAASEDAFDALVSALAMWRRRDELRRLRRDEASALEGRIWVPGAV